MNERSMLALARVLALAGLAFWGYFLMRNIFEIPLFLNSAGDSALPLQIAFGVYGYAVLLFGVVLGAVYREIRARRQAGRKTIKIFTVMRQALSTIDFWLGVFASPVVYAVLLQAVDLTSISVSGFVGITLVGLQNGFACNAVADALLDSGRTAPADVKSQD